MFEIHTESLLAFTQKNALSAFFSNLVAFSVNISSLPEISDEYLSCFCPTACYDFSLCLHLF